jgi:hypothetical protein
MGRPKGSKSKSREGYTRRTERLKKEHGDDVFRKWGKRGGNPVLLKQKEKR